MPQAHISRIENAMVDLQASSLVELARALDLELMLVPRKYVPAVKGLLRVSQSVEAGEGPPRPAYSVREGEDG